MNYKAWVTKAAKQPMVLETVDPGPLGDEEVEVAVEHCGLCHSDLSVLNNEWGMSQYPAMLGHEVVGRITAVGPQGQGTRRRAARRRRLVLGQLHALPPVHVRQPPPLPAGASDDRRPSRRVRVARPRALGVGHPAAGEAERRRRRARCCAAASPSSPRWRCTPSRPTASASSASAGSVTWRVKFAAAYGCDVTAFTSSESKFDEAKGFGADHVVSSRDSAAIKKLAGSFDLLISTVNVPLDWDAMIGTLAPNGRLHVVGAVLEPIPVAAFSLISQQRSVSGSPTGSPVAIATMLDFAARHDIAPQTEHFPMSHINEAFARLESGKARYRIVLDADF